MNQAFEPVRKCRICASRDLYPAFYLANQALTSVFPKTREERVTCGPLELVVCNVCGLVQLGHSYSLTEIYGDSYGYRSGLNASMAAHLKTKAYKLARQRPFASFEVVLDIGSNDGTLLNEFAALDWGDVGPRGFHVGIDPLANKFRRFYEEGIEVVAGFFTENVVRKVIEDRRCAIITSIAMFYDLPDPNAFVRDVAALLAEDGIWHVEMSYLPLMLAAGSIDTICHEHLEYYSLTVLNNLFASHGLKIVDAETNQINGGSIALTVMHEKAQRNIDPGLIQWMLEQDKTLELDKPWTYRKFCHRAFETRDSLRALIGSLKRSGKRVGALGASTKGNVLLQYCGFTSNEIEFIADVNPEKHGRFTPGTLIPIVSEEEGRALKPDYMLVPIWHFRNEIIQREREYLREGGKLIFPLPRIEVVG